MEFDSGTDTLMVRIDDGGIGRLIFDNRDRHNALSVEMQAALPAALAWLNGAESVQVIVVSGAGDKAFMSGADISEFGSRPNSTDGGQTRISSDAPAWGYWSDVTKPVVAMIGGYCIGAGLLVALRADIRICSDDSTFGVPAARLGLGYGFPGVEALVQVTGISWASEILFSGRRLSAHEALSAGLVNRVVTREELEPTVIDLAESIAGNAPLTLAALKAGLTQARLHPGRRDLSGVEALVRRCFESADFVEGQQAFLEKRRPRFTGR